MNQSQTKSLNEPQVPYMGRFVNPKFFRAFVYNKDGEETLANSWDEFKKLISSGEWFESREAVKNSLSEDLFIKKERGRPRNDSIRTAS